MSQRFCKIGFLLLVIALVPLLTFANGDDGHDHDEESVVEVVEIEPTQNHGFVEEGGMVNGLGVGLDTTPKSLTTNEIVLFEVSMKGEPEDGSIQTQQVDIVGVREDLSNFFYINSNEVGGVWGAEYAFSNPGIYRVWSLVEQGDDITAFGHKKVSVSGEGELKDTPIEFLENVIIEHYQMSLDLHDQLTAGTNNEITLTLSDVFGRGVEIEGDVLLTIIGSDFTSFIHTNSGEYEEAEGVKHDHVDEIDAQGSFRLIEKLHAHVEDNNLDVVESTFNINFPKDGIYKMFAQFTPIELNSNERNTLVAEFYVRVKPDPDGKLPVVGSDDKNFAGDGHTDHTHAPALKGEWYESTQWWVLFLGSLVLMTLLSLYVRRYLQFKD